MDVENELDNQPAAATDVQTEVPNSSNHTLYQSILAVYASLGPISTDEELLTQSVIALMRGQPNLPPSVSRPKCCGKRLDYHDLANKCLPQICLRVNDRVCRSLGQVFRES